MVTGKLLVVDVLQDSYSSSATVQCPGHGNAPPSQGGNAGNIVTGLQDVAMWHLAVSDKGR